MKPQLALVLAIFTIPFVIQAQWQVQHTGFADSMHAIQSIWAVDENIAWAMADYTGPGDTTIQRFTRTTDGGTNWVSGMVNSASELTPSMIFALNSDTAYIAFHDPDIDGGRIMRTADGGVNWVHQPSAIFSSAEGAYPNLVYFWDDQNGFAMGDPTEGYFEIYTTSSAGALWERVDSANIPAIISGEWGYEREFTVIGNTVWFGTSKGRVFKSTDRGYSWTVINTPLLNIGRCRMVEFRDSLHGIVSDRVGSLADMYETNDGGLSWQQIVPGGVAYGRYLEYIPGTDSTYISSSDNGSPQGVSISYDDGHNWMSIADPGISSYGVLGFANQYGGWAGQENQGGGIGGIVKYLGNTVGVNEDRSPSFSLWPNPTNGRINILIGSSEGGNSVKVLDITGRLIEEMHCPDDIQMQFDLGYLAPGHYFIILDTDQGEISRKLVLTHR